MTRILISSVLLLFSIITNAQTENTIKNKISVQVKDIPVHNGKVYFAIYDKEGFLPKKAIARKHTSVLNNQATVVFDSIPNGNYAIICFLDENDNKRLDFDMNSGRPTEYFGISNNPTLFGPPQFNSAKFEVKNKDLQLEISLQ